MRPDDIPQDVWDAAWESMLPSWKAAADGMPYPNIEFNQSIIARAILAERERCLKRVAYWGKAAGHSDDGSFGALLGILKGGE